MKFKKEVFKWLLNSGLQNSRIMSNNLSAEHACMLRIEELAVSQNSFCKISQEGDHQTSSQSLHDQTVKTTLDLLKSIRALSLGFHH